MGSDAVTPAQPSGAAPAPRVISLAGRWARSEGGNAVLPEVVVPAVELNQRFLSQGLAEQTHPAEIGVAIFGSAGLIVRL